MLSCGTLLGLDDYEVGETPGTGGTGAGGTPANGGTGGTATGGSAGNGGTSTGGIGGTAGNGAMGGSAGASTGGAGEGGTGECECQARNPCMVSSCVDGDCVEAPRRVGAACQDAEGGPGVCDDEQTCVRCVDDKSGSDRDSGCPLAAPECDDSVDPPECTGCGSDGDCDDAIECTVDRCTSGRCTSEILPAGSTCDAGVCNGQGNEDSCVTCLDDSVDMADSGCSSALPDCVVADDVRQCAECVEDADCDDDNPCTNETCNAGACTSETVSGGTPCLGGYCNGVEGMEACGDCFDSASGNATDLGCDTSAPLCDLSRVPAQCTGCTTNGQCNDDIACTTDVCNGSGVCVRTPDDGACPDSGDVCMPNQCVPGMGCQAVDVTENLSQMLANGYFDSGGIAWQEYSSNGFYVIASELDTGITAHTPSRYAWMGGAVNELSAVTQQVDLPDGTQELALSFYYIIGTADSPPDDLNHMGVQLRSADGSTVLYDFVEWANQDEILSWTKFTDTVDVSAWAGTEVQLYFWCESVGGVQGMTDVNTSNFFVDTVTLSATVCD